MIKNIVFRKVHINFQTQLQIAFKYINVSDTLYVPVDK